MDRIKMRETSHSDDEGAEEHCAERLQRSAGCRGDSYGRASGGR
jgi:hypothetical protein